MSSALAAAQMYAAQLSSQQQPNMYVIEISNSKLLAFITDTNTSRNKFHLIHFNHSTSVRFF